MTDYNGSRIDRLRDANTLTIVITPNTAFVSAEAFRPTYQFSSLETCARCSIGDFGLVVTFYCNFYCNRGHIFSLISVSLLGGQACGISESHIGKNMTEINIIVASVADIRYRSLHIVFQFWHRYHTLAKPWHCSVIAAGRCRPVIMSATFTPTLNATFTTLCYINTNTQCWLHERSAARKHWDQLDSSSQ